MPKITARYSERLVRSQKDEGIFLAAQLVIAQDPTRHNFTEISPLRGLFASDTAVTERHAIRLHSHPRAFPSDDGCNPSDLVRIKQGRGKRIITIQASTV
mmetsp:Transcript_13533/g.30724  ORF Transcript_13533/g.30724 Transcript_13533/m.30724 type:complete len:100 (-) Transcript_13533:90-389(-)